MRRSVIPALLALCTLLAGGGASAQVDQVFDPSPPQAARAASPLVGTAFEPIVRLGRDLLDFGVLPRLRYVQSFAANPIGGITQSPTRASRADRARRVSSTPTAKAASAAPAGRPARPRAPMA